MGEPTPAQMAQLERLEADYASAVAAGRSEMVWRVKRRPGPDAKQIRIAPGLTGRLVAWGDGTWRSPSVAFVKTEAVGAFLKRCREQVEQEQPGRASAGEGDA